MIMLNKPVYSELFLLSGVLRGDDYAKRPNVIVIPVTKEYVQSLIVKIEAARAMREKDDQFISLEFSDDHAQWIKQYVLFHDTRNLNGQLVLDAFVVNLTGYELVSTLPTIDDDEDRERVDASTIVVTPEGVKWQAVLKNGSDVIYSETFSVETLTRILDLLG